MRSSRTLIYLIGVILLLAIPLGLILSAADTNSDGVLEIDTREVEESVENFATDAVKTTEAVARTTANSIDNFFDRLFATPQNSLARALLIVGGVILLVAGWRIYDEIIILAGILVGAFVALAAVGDANAILQIAAMLVGAIVGAALSIMLYYVAIFFIGAYIGLALTFALAGVFGLETVSALILLIGAIIGGLLLLGLSFQFVILVSALVGAQMLTLGLGWTSEWILIFLIIGVIAQFVAIRSLDIDIRRRPRRYSWNT